MTLTAPTMPRGAITDPQEKSYYPRFNMRFWLFQKWMLIAYPVMLGILVVTQHVSLTMLAIQICTYLVVALFMRFSRNRDSMTLFVVTFAFWLYSFMLVLYALLHWKSPEDDLYAPWRSSLIVLVTLLSCMAGYGIAQIALRWISLPRLRRSRTASEKRSTGYGLVVCSLPFVLLPFLGLKNGFVNAIAGAFQPLLWLGLIIFCVGRGPRWAVSPLVLGVAAISLVLSVAFNGRNVLLSFGLTAIVLYFAISDRPLHAGRLILLYLGANALTAFSKIMLVARQLAGHEGSVPIVVRALGSVDFLLAMLGFGTSLDNKYLLQDELRRHDHYLLYMFDGRLGLFERLTEIVHMDIIIGRLSPHNSIDWAEVKNSFLSALPSVFGQDKILDYSDRIVWDLDLISREVVGHPLVTAAGEFYAMGGFPIVVLGFVLIFSSTFVLYEISKRIFVDRFVAAASLLVFSIFLVFSSSAISALAVPMRIYPLTFLLFPLIDRTWGSLIGGENRARAVPVRQRVL